MRISLCGARTTKTIEIALYVAPENSPIEDLLLGNDFINKHGHIYDLFSDNRDTPNGQVHVIVVKEPTASKPRHQIEGGGT